MGIYIIVLVSYYNYKRDFVSGMAVAGFLTFIIAWLFWLGGFVSGVTLVFVIAVTIASIILLFFGKREL
jgi:hypothetical protein